MPKRDVLRQKMKQQGLTDQRLERGRRVNLFDLLRSLGVDNPKQTFTRFVHDEIKTSKTVQEAATQANEGTLSLGPWRSDGILGFVNRTGYPIELSDETTRGSATIEWRRLEGITKTTFPITIPNGNIYEVSVTGIGSGAFGGAGDTAMRFYIAYKAKKG